MVSVDSTTTRVVVGQRVYCMLYGGSYGIVTAIHGEQSPESCHGCGVRFGGSAHFDIVFDDHESRMLPESILRGVQWRIFGDVATADEILDAIRDCRAEQGRAKLRELAANDQHGAQVEDLRTCKEYAHLEQIGEKHASGVQVAKNVRKQLKKHFPGFKFGVTSDYSSVNIRWEDGPTSKQVDAVVDIFQVGNFNGMTDCYETGRNAFCEVYGGCRYVFTRRDVSDECQRLAFAAAFPDGLNVRDASYRELPAEYWNLPNDAASFIRPAIYETAFDRDGNPLPRTDE